MGIGVDDDRCEQSGMESYGREEGRLKSYRRRLAFLGDED